MTKLHWTQTEEGKKRMSEIQKLAHQRVREAKGTRTYKKTTNGSGKGVVITIEGPGTNVALAELLSNIQYDKLDVHIKIQRV